MRILLLGVFRHGSTDNYKLTALRRAGHDVLPYPYREKDPMRAGQYGWGFDLVVVSKGSPTLTEAHYDHLATRAPRRVIYWPDPVSNWTEANTHAARNGWDVAATCDLACEVSGARRTARILEGADCIGDPWDRPPDVEPALLHFGHLSPRRMGILARLREAGVHVNHLDAPLYGWALQREVVRHAGVLGINSSPELYSNRVQTVLAIGGVMVQEDAPGLREDFAGHRGLVIWTEDDLPPRWPDGLLDEPMASHPHTWDTWAERVVAFAKEDGDA